MDNKEIKPDNKNTYKLIIYILIIVVIIAVAFICYDKFINTEKPPVSSETQVNNTVKRIELTNTNQVVNLGGNEFKIREATSEEGSYLLINDTIRYVEDMETAYADYAYITNNFIIFTSDAQDWEMISYVIDKDDREILVDDYDKNNNETVEHVPQYQLHDFKYVDGKLQASGHIFCGLDVDCPDIDLMINYENDTLVVMPK